MTGKQDRRIDSLLPLHPVVFQILLVLIEESLHGYEIVKRVEQEIGRSPRLEPANLYRSLRRLLHQGIIEESDDRPEPEADDSRRRYFRLTDFGREVVLAEAHRLERQVLSAQARQLLGSLDPAEKTS